MSRNRSMVFALSWMLALGLSGASAQNASDPGDMARLLSNQDTRQSAVDMIAAAGQRYVPMLLSWTRQPPADLDQNELKVGLADALGRLRTAGAIPFLIENISLRRDRAFDLRPWTKTPAVIEESFPAVMALIRIGPAAAEAVIGAYDRLTTPDGRLAAIFVVTHVATVPEAGAFRLCARI